MPPERLATERRLDVLGGGAAIERQRRPGLGGGDPAVEVIEVAEAGEAASGPRAVHAASEPERELLAVHPPLPRRRIGRVDVQVDRPFVHRRAGEGGEREDRQKDQRRRAEGYGPVFLSEHAVPAPATRERRGDGADGLRGEDRRHGGRVRRGDGGDDGGPRRDPVTARDPSAAAHDGPTGGAHRPRGARVRERHRGRGQDPRREGADEVVVPEPERRHGADVRGIELGAGMRPLKVLERAKLLGIGVDLADVGRHAPHVSQASPAEHHAGRHPADAGGKRRGSRGVVVSSKGFPLIARRTGEGKGGRRRRSGVAPEDGLRVPLQVEVVQAAPSPDGPQKIGHDYRPPGHGARRRSLPMGPETSTRLVLFSFATVTELGAHRGGKSHRTRARLAAHAERADVGERV